MMRSRLMPVRSMVLPLSVVTAMTLGAPSGARASSAPGTHGDGKCGKRPSMLSTERLAKMEPAKNGRYVVPLEAGTRAELTLEPKVQKLAERVLKQHGTPWGAAVVLSIADGRVLAMAGQAPEQEKSAAELCTTAWAPAASVFKLVTAAALLVEGVRPSAKVCYHDGIHSVEANNLKDQPKLDRDCNTLSYGLAKSQNAIVARFAVDHLNVPALSAMARAFGFGGTVPADVSSAPSTASIPDDSLSFARVAAGFWHTTLSPLHGAWLAATIARGGITPPVHVVQRVVEDGGAVESPSSPQTRRVLDEDVAKALGRMMIGTTEFGTARRSFRDKDGKPVLRGISVAGKTGTLTRRDGKYLLYSWFVGFAPAQHPKIAFAVLLGNGDSRYVRAHQVAKDLLHGYFRGGAGEGRDLLAKR